MNQTEAHRWLQKNIDAFGGKPDNIPIAGESAGSSSVCAQIVSPLPRNLFAGAVGESGSVLKFKSVVSLSEAEKYGLQYANFVGAHSLKELRAMSAEQLINATEKPEMADFTI